MENTAVAIRTGYLLPDGEPVGTGSTQPIKAMAATTTGEITVIAKRLSPRQIAVETICAVFGRIAGLPIPEPILLKDENQQWVYGSVYIDHPNFAQYASATESAVARELAKWPGLSGAACFDELIANPDRNDENLLYDGTGFFLIDHDMCLPAGMAANDCSEDYYTNSLLELRASECEDDAQITRVTRELCDWADAIPDNGLKNAQRKASAVAHPETIDELSDFLVKRINNLAVLLEKKLKPIAQQRLAFHVEP